MPPSAPGGARDPARLIAAPAVEAPGPLAADAAAESRPAVKADTDHQVLALEVDSLHYGARDPEQTRPYFGPAHAASITNPCRMHIDPGSYSGAACAVRQHRNSLGNRDATRRSSPTPGSDTIPSRELLVATPRRTMWP